MRTALALVVLDKARRIVADALAGRVVDPIRLAWAKFITKANP